MSNKQTKYCVFTDRWLFVAAIHWLLRNKPEIRINCTSIQCASPDVIAPISRLAKCFADGAPVFFSLDQGVFCDMEPCFIKGRENDIKKYVVINTLQKFEDWLENPITVEPKKGDIYYRWNKQASKYEYIQFSYHSGFNYSFQEVKSDGSFSLFCPQELIFDKNWREEIKKQGYQPSGGNYFEIANGAVKKFLDNLGVPF